MPSGCSWRKTQNAQTNPQTVQRFIAQTDEAIVVAVVEGHLFCNKKRHGIQKSHELAAGYAGEKIAQPT